MKLKTRFLLFTSALTALFAVLMIYDTVSTARNGMLDRAEDRANYLVSFITEISAKQLESGHTAGLEKLLAAFENFEQISYLRVSDSKGNVIYRMGHPGILIDERVPNQDIFNSGSEIYDTARDIIRDGRKLGTIQIGISIAGIRESVEVLMWRGIIIALGFLALITGTVWLLTLKLGRQLDALLELTEEMDSETLHEAPRSDTDTDTGRIAFALREMHSRLKAEKTRRLEAETQKDDFFAMTVHDLKQPLTSLKASLDLLLSEEERRAYSAEQLNNLSEIARTSLRMLNTMVVDILNTAKIKNRDYVPEKERIPLAALLRECAEESSASVTAAGKKWFFSMPEDIGAAWVFGDRDMIKRVVGNLVLNAIQYTPEGGAIKLGTRFVSGDKAALYVSDEGEGIPDNFREEIFKKYRTMSKSSKNIGLGLAFCKMVADMHSAAMDVSSEKGKGTEVSFVIPVSHGTETKKA
jgi:signal transduction histidine kinase